MSIDTSLALISIFIGLLGLIGVGGFIFIKKNNISSNNKNTGSGNQYNAGGNIEINTEKGKNNK